MNMRRFYFLIAVLVFSLCACTTGGDDVTDGNEGAPGTEQTNPSNPDNGGDENGSEGETGNEGNEGGSEGGNEGGTEGGEGSEGSEGGSEGGENGEQQPVFNISVTEHTVEYDAGTLIVGVECEDIKRLEISIPEECLDWLDLYGASDGKIFFWLSDNKENAVRTAAVVITDGVTGQSITLHISQKPEVARYIKVTPQSPIEVEAKGVVLDVTVEAVVGKEDYFIRYDDSVSAPDWCWLKMQQESGVADTESELIVDKYTLTVMPNTAAEPRSVVVTFKNYKYNLLAEWTISQKGYVSDGVQSELRYTTTDGKVATGTFDVPIISNVYANGEGVITFDGSLTTIYSFSSTKLATVTIPDSVQVLGDYAMSNCDNLRKVVIGKGVKKFGKRILWGSSVNTDLEVELNSNIGAGAFDDSLVNKLTIGSNVTEIGDEAFADCVYLEKVTFSEGLKRIGRYAFSSHYCFFYKLPNSLEVIGECAFTDCHNLIAVSIGNNTTCKIKEIGSRAFYDTDITTLVCYATTPPKYGDYALYKDNESMGFEPIATCPIFVPEASWSRYKNATGWKVHANMISVITDELEDGMKDWK